EVLGLDVGPAAECLLDSERLDCGKAARKLLQHLLVTRAEGVLAYDLLALRREQELEVGGGDLPAALLVDDLLDHRHGRRRLDAERGIDDLELVGSELGADGKRLVL